MTTPVATLKLSAETVLSTTRAVRRRLDLQRPVDPALLEDCTRVAQQAPSGRNRQRWDFVFVTEPELRSEVAHLWRRGLAHPHAPSRSGPSRQAFNGDATWEAISASLDHLAANLERVPVLLIPCIQVGARSEMTDPVMQAGAWGSVLPAVWSFMLAARNRGLGTVWTTPHLHYEREVAKLLGISYDTAIQCALIPVAHSIGTDFKPGKRVDTRQVLHWNQW